MGPYSEALAVLQTGLIDKLGIKHVAIGGHPEGNVAYGGRDVMQILKDKIDFGLQSDAEFRIATQFGFDGPKFVDWARSVKQAGIDAPIHLGGEAVEDEVLLHVTDRGIGIPATDLENIFNRFYQVADDRSRSRAQRGSGLGLAIVKHLARRHGGSIDVRSELGVGSTFTLRFPRDDDADS